MKPSSYDDDHEDNSSLDFDNVHLKYTKKIGPGHPAHVLGFEMFNMNRRDWTLLSLIGFIGFFIRFFRISQPDSVVFDEVHFGGFAAKTVRGEYFFDVHPPLAKLMLSGVAWLYGFDGEFDFKDIGKSFVGQNVPYIAMRSAQALFGWLLIPTAFLTSRVNGLTTETSALAAIMVLLENALITQSRYILLDSPLLFFTGGTILSYSMFCNQHTAFTKNWWSSLLATGVFMGLNLSCKWVGLFTVALIGLSTLKQLWNLLGDLEKTPNEIFHQFLGRFACLFMVPIVIYMMSFQIQFMVLHKYTEAASSMSSEFQNTLDGNGLIAAKQDIIYGSKLRINHVATNGGYLHSHLHNYPGGSNQQQITLYPFRDENNFWIIEKGFDGNNNETESDQIEYVKNKDIVRLRHIKTSKRIHSHNVRPVFSDKDYVNEVSGYQWPDSNDNFKVDILHGDKRNPESSERLMAIYSRFRLIHVNTGCVLYSRPEKLPDWGFKQQQVFCIRDGMKPRSEWVVETNIHEKLNDNPSVTYSQVGFFGKFFETNQRMWVSNSGLTSSHPFDSRPQAWPFLRRGISFWGKNHMQVYLMGNPLVWYLGSLSVIAFFIVQIILSLLRKRNVRVSSSGAQSRYFNDAGFYVLGWCLHYFPFFLMQRQLFLHHYLPALYLSILTFVVSLDIIIRRFRPQFRLAVIGGFSLAFFILFFKYSALIYGLEWSQSSCTSAQWFKHWDFDCKIRS